MSVKTSDIAPEPSADSLTQHRRRGRKYSFVVVRGTTRKGEVKWRSRKGEEKTIRVRMLLLSTFHLHTHGWVECLVGTDVTYVRSKARSLWSVIFHRPLLLIIMPVALIINFFFSCGAAAQRGPWPPHSWGFLITHNEASQSVGLLWTSDQFVAETSAWQHTTLTSD